MSNLFIERVVFRDELPKTLILLKQRGSCVIIERELWISHAPPPFNGGGARVQSRSATR